MKKGALIVFDGIDGSGKTTQVKILASYLRKKGLKVAILSEPSSRRYGRIINKLLRDKNSSNLSKNYWFKLFNLDAMDNLKNEVIPKLKKGFIVLEDRYFYSTLAYQLPISKWKNYAKKFTKPDLTFIFDVPINIAMKRIAKKYEKDKKKRTIFENVAKLKKTKKFFLLIVKKFRLKRIDASKSIKEIFKKIKKEVSKIIRER